jgi:hypothetical protein
MKLIVCNTTRRTKMKVAFKYEGHEIEITNESTLSSYGIPVALVDGEPVNYLLVTGATGLYWGQGTPPMVIVDKAGKRSDSGTLRPSWDVK